MPEKLTHLLGLVGTVVRDKDEDGNPHIDLCRDGRTIFISYDRPDGSVQVVIRDPGNEEVIYIDGTTVIWWNRKRGLK